YAASGIRSDHEALTLEEGRERLRAGIWLLVREASMARNLTALAPLISEFGPSQIAFCTDDRDPDDIVDDGHINGMVRKAVAIGLVPDQVVTESLELDASAGDLVKIAVVERHLATGRVGLGFVHGSGLQRGALASTVAHDAHNIVVLGASDADMRVAVERVVQ